jgi:Skp family chaperone for outer membrane proteins
MDRWIAGTAALAMAVLVAVAPAAAQKMPAAAVAVVDSQRIGRDAAAFKSARQQLDQYRAGYQAEIAREEEALRTEEQELSRQRTVLAPDAFEARRRDFERKVTEVQRRVQDRSRQLEQSFNGVRAEVGKQLVAIVRELANERGITLVLDRAQVMFHADSIDVTGEVLKRLDQRLPSVKVSVPAGK